jgi:transitional endoplasmic reticulum ATPase
MTEWGTLARVRSVTDDGRRVYLELRNHSVGTIDADTPSGWAVGDILVVYGDETAGYRAEPAPREIWGDETWAGVARLKLDDISVIDSAGSLRIVPTTQVDYAEGNTVEVREFVGVVRKLHDNPIRYIDLPTVDDAAIARFRHSDTPSGPTFDDFGGLQDVVVRARELIALPLRRRAALDAVGARQIKGVLFTGAPGTGKTLLGRIIAAEAGATFFEIRGPEIFSKWYGQTGEVLRKIFDSAASEPSAIIFFDEIDSVAGRRGETAHEESNRVVAQLLTLMDGFSATANVVVIATTNRPNDIDPALRRPGRFDWEINFPLPGISDRAAIFRAAGRSVAMLGPIPGDLVAAKTDGWSAADIAAIWSEAAILAVDDDRDRVSLEDVFGGLERVERQRQSKMLQFREEAL